MWMPPPTLSLLSCLQWWFKLFDRNISWKAASALKKSITLHLNLFWWKSIGKKHTEAEQRCHYIGSTSKHGCSLRFSVVWLEPTSVSSKVPLPAVSNAAGTRCARNFLTATFHIYCLSHTHSRWSNLRCTGFVMLGPKGDIFRMLWSETSSIFSSSIWCCAFKVWARGKTIHVIYL